MDEAVRRLLGRIERDVAALRERLESQDAATEGADEMKDPYDERDAAVRRTPGWPPRGKVMHLLESERGKVTFDRWKKLGDRCGYRDGRGMNGFFAGDPPVVVREGDFIVITERGRSAARYWRRHFGGRDATGA